MLIDDDQIKAVKNGFELESLSTAPVALRGYG